MISPNTTKAAASNPSIRTVAAALLHHGAANQIGPAACWMLTVISQQSVGGRQGDDGFILMSNAQLRIACGIATPATFTRVRERAAAAGWLTFESTEKGPSRYRVHVPN